MNINRLKSMSIFVLGVLCVFQVFSIWFGSTDSFMASFSGIFKTNRVAYAYNRLKIPGRMIASQLFWIPKKSATM